MPVVSKPASIMRRPPSPSQSRDATSDSRAGFAETRRGSKHRCARLMQQLPENSGRSNQMAHTADLKTVELTTSLLTASGRLRKYGGGAGSGINPGSLFEVGQSLIGMFLILNKLKSLKENLSAAAVIHQQTM